MKVISKRTTKRIKANLNNIKIPKELIRDVSTETLNYLRDLYFKDNGKTIEKNVCVDDQYVLSEGYPSYLVLKELDKREYIKPFLCIRRFSKG